MITRLFVLAYFTLVFGELVPKRLAMKKSEGIAYFVVLPLTGLSKLTNPVVKFLTFSTNLILRVIGVDPNSADEEVTEEDIRLMVDFPDIPSIMISLTTYLGYYMSKIY